MIYAHVSKFFKALLDFWLAEWIYFEKYWQPGFILKSH